MCSDLCHPKGPPYFFTNYSLPLFQVHLLKKWSINLMSPFVAVTHTWASVLITPLKLSPRRPCWTLASSSGLCITLSGFPVGHKTFPWLFFFKDFLNLERESAHVCASRGRGRGRGRERVPGRLCTEGQSPMWGLIS